MQEEAKYRIWTQTVSFLSNSGQVPRFTSWHYTHTTESSQRKATGMCNRKVILAVTLIACTVSCVERDGRCKTCHQHRAALLDAVNGNHTDLIRTQKKLVKVKGMLKKLQTDHQEADRRFNAAMKENTILINALTRSQEAYRLLLEEFQDALTLNNQRSEYQEYLIKDAEYKLAKSKRDAYEINTELWEVNEKLRKEMTFLKVNFTETQVEKDSMENYYGRTLRGCVLDETRVQKALLVANQEKGDILRDMKAMELNYSQLVTEKDAMEDFYVDAVKILLHEHAIKQDANDDTLL
ncbi:hypothetical protein E2C01_030288 [Portunus trituberculatus]|uniref:Uncharacterized protein n=1 Tax=Portunus trituberculatus TaxID=210409 RepID=A0A5B7EQG9_PORTR|nr:hypothetical protein [Portunus trituberculatus]